MLMRNRKIVFGILIVLFLFNLSAWFAVYQLSQNNLKVNFFDVGQGDAIFIETPQMHQILIDGGPGSIILEKLGENLPFWDRTIDLIVLTHPESDHLSGLLAVLKRYKVENILWTGIVRDTLEFKEWQRLIGEEEKEGAKINIAKSNQKISWDKDDNFKNQIEILFPLENLNGKELKDSNDSSIVSRLIFGRNSFLFTGDIHQSSEKEILEKGIEIDSDILKVSHHGSKTSNNENFIKKVLPEIAVIQCGKNNSYGHPHQETLEILEKYDINIFRTDLNGDIKIISNGRTYEVSNLQN